MAIFKFVQKFADDPGYFAKRSGIYAVGKHAAHEIAHPIAEAVQEPLGEAAGQLLGTEGANYLSAAATGLGGSLAGVLTVGLTAGLSASLTQMDYNRNIEKLKEDYKYEIAAKQELSVDKVTTKDLDKLARDNTTIAEELQQLKQQRNWGMGLSVLASITALAVVMVALPAAITAMGFAAETATTGLLGFAIKSAVGISTYHIVKDPLHWLGDKMFGIDKETTHNRIEDIKRCHDKGKDVTPEQVLSVFAGSNRQLDRLIVAEYGNHYDELAPAVRHRAADEIGKLIPLNQLAEDINQRKISVRELAFAVDGQESGFVPKLRTEENRPGMLGALFARIGNAFHSKSRGTEAGESIPPAPSLPVRQPVEYDNAPPAVSFVQQLGRPKREFTDLSQVQLLEQQGERVIS